MDIDEELKKIKDEVLNCRRCLLYKTRKYPVIGEGNHRAKIMFIGEAPGRQEDMSGRPFCGAAGNIFDELLNFTGIERQDVYVTNILKCRPPFNRDPSEQEIEACSPYLERQVAVIKPKVICSLGRYSMRFLMEKFGLESEIKQISLIHGKIFKADSQSNLLIIPFYHPAVAVYNPKMKEVLKKDFTALKKINSG